MMVLQFLLCGHTGTLRDHLSAFNGVRERKQINLRISCALQLSLSFNSPFGLLIFKAISLHSYILKPNPQSCRHPRSVL